MPCLDIVLLQVEMSSTKGVLRLRIIERVPTIACLLSG
jgi:hypothetical protein